MKPSIFKNGLGKSWIIAFLAFALTMAVGIYLTDRVLPKSNKATATIQLHSGNLGVVIGAELNPAPFDSSFAKDRELLASPPILLPVMEHLHLAQSWSRLEPRLQGEPLTQDMALKHLQGQVRFEVVRGTNLILISVRSTDPQEAADIANQIAEVFKSCQDREQYKDYSRTGSESLMAEIKQQTAAANDARRKMLHLKALLPSGINIPLESEDENEDDQFAGLKGRLLTAREDFDARRVLHQKVTDLSNREFIATLNAMGHLDPRAVQIQSESSKLESDLEKLLKEGAAPEQSEVQAIQKRINSKQERVEALVVQSRQQLKWEMETAEAQVKLLQGELDAVEKVKRNLHRPEWVSYADARHQLKIEKSRLEALKIRLSSGSDFVLPPAVKIISRAQVPTFPSSSNPQLYYGIAFLIALALGGITFRFLGFRRRKSVGGSP